MAQRQADVEELVNKLPKAVFPTPKKVPYCAPTAAAEKCIMKKLGFTGTLPTHVTDHILEGFLTGKMGLELKFIRAGYVFPEILDRVVAEMQHGRVQAQMAMPPGLTMKSWVGCHIHEIGYADEDGNLLERA